MQRYRDFYALHCTADPRQRREAVAALERSIGIEPGASACFLDLLDRVGLTSVTCSRSPMASRGSALWSA
jgi:hypothetical protein